MLRLPSSFQVSGSVMLEAGEALEGGAWEGREEGPNDCITGIPTLIPPNKSCDGCVGARLSPPRRSRFEAGGCIKGGMDVGPGEDSKEALVGVARGFMAGDIGADIGRDMSENKSMLLALAATGAAVGNTENKSWPVSLLPPPPNAEEKSAKPSFSLLLLTVLSVNAVGKPGAD